MQHSARVIRGFVWRDLQLALTSRVPFLFDGIGMFAALAVYYFIGQFARPTSTPAAVGYFTFAVSGVAVLRMQTALARIILALEREQATGTLELTFLSPASTFVVAVGTCLYELLRGIAFCVLVLLGSRVIFGLGLTLGPRAWPGLAFGLLGGAGFFFALSLLAGAVLVAFKHGTPFATLLGLGLPVFSGAYFSVNVLPSGVEWVAQVLPLTYAIELVRDGVVAADFSGSAALKMAAGLAVVCPLAAAAFRVSVDRARRLGALAHQ